MSGQDKRGSIAIKPSPYTVRVRFDRSAAIWRATCSAYSSAEATGQTADAALSVLANIIQLYETEITAVIHPQGKGFSASSPQLGDMESDSLHGTITLMATRSVDYSRRVMNDE